MLKGDPQPGEVTGFHPHFRVPVRTDSGSFTIDVNVESFDNSEVLYAVIQNFKPPDAASLLAMPDGATTLPRRSGGLALDYVRGTSNGSPIVTRSAMTLLPIGRGADLHDQVSVAVNQAIEDEAGVICAFGSAFADGGGVRGIHDIHMNQGNPRNNHGQDNGIWQDGGMFIYLPSRNRWIAVLIAFQTQTWQTDDNGNPLEALTSPL
jgi:uncharacterized protein YukJ